MIRVYLNAYSEGKQIYIDCYKIEVKEDNIKYYESIYEWVLNKEVIERIEIT